MAVEEDLSLVQPGSDRSWRFDLVPGLFFRPRSTLSQVAATNQPTWRAPILLLLLVAVAHALLAGSIVAAAKAGGQPALPPNFEFYTPEQQAQYMQAATATNNVTFNYILPALRAALGVVAGWLVIGWLLHLLLTLFGGRGTSQQALNLAAWASLPLLLRYLVQIAAMLVTDQLVGTAGLGGFAPGGEGVAYSLGAALLGQIDLYILWQIGLLLLGAKIISQISTLKAAVAVALTFLIVMLLRALPGAILAQFGDLTVIQPFM
jgi:hypothetical protein